MTNRLKQKVAVLAACASLATSSLAEPLSSASCEIGQPSIFNALAKGYERRYGTAFDPASDQPINGDHGFSKNAVTMNGDCQSGGFGRAAAGSTRLNPVAWDALVIIVHPDNPINNLSLAQLREIYDGRIVNWHQLGGDDLPLELQVRHDKRTGIGLTLRELVFQDPERDFIAAAVHPHSEALEQTVENNPYALAVAGANSARERRVKVLNLEDKTASYHNIRSGAYLLYRPLYIAYAWGNPLRTRVEKLIEYAHSREGREIIRNQGAVPYLDALNLVSRHDESKQPGRGS